MSPLPTRFAPVILPFSRLFRQRTWRQARALLLGAILAPGVRTVASVLRVLGLARERHFVNYHRVLSRAAWSPRAASRVLLALLVRAFVPEGPVVLGLDDTIERRRGKRIRAKGIYRDPVHSSHSHFVKTSGLRWLSLMLLAPIPWAHRVWALPVLTALAPSERYDQERGRRHKRLTDWARQLLVQVRRWLAVIAPGRAVILVADMSFAAFELLGALAPQLTCITRLRLDAQLYAPAPPRPPGTVTRWERVTVPGWYGEGPRAVELASGTAIWYHGGLPVLPIRWVVVRDPLQHFDPVALLATDLALSAIEIVQYFVRRWQVEVTFEETRRHLGLESQRQWADLAIARTTPVLLGLFSLVTLLAAALPAAERPRARTAAWYPKPVPTFSDTLAAVRRHYWRVHHFRTSRKQAEKRKPSRALVARLTEALCYAA